MHERALRYVAQQDLEKASKLYEEIILIDPEDDQAYVIMGHTYLLTGHYEKAEHAFKNAVHIDPANADEIVPFYQNIIMQNANDDVAYNNLGYAYLILGDYLNARDAFLRALELNPDNAAAQDGMTTLGTV
jgi:Tfp pilus assembly protein PilF